MKLFNVSLDDQHNHKSISPSICVVKVEEVTQDEFNKILNDVNDVNNVKEKEEENE